MSTSPMTLTKPLRYFDGVTDVRIGDVVSARVWFIWKKTGRVVYVPGISKKHGDFEHHGLCWVGIRADDGLLFGEIVRLDTGCLKKDVRLIRRDDSPCDVITPEMVFDE